MSVHLIEAAPRLLSTMSKEASKKATEFLTTMGVQIWLDTMVNDFNGEEVKTNTKHLPSKTLIWAAGVQGAPVAGIGFNKQKRISTNEFFNADGHDNIFSIGDLAVIKTETLKNGYPMLASVACQQGVHLAKNFKRMLLQKPVVPFSYNDQGTMATVGRNRAVVDLPHYKFQGRIAWYIWMFVHLILLVGFRNKVVAIVNWVWSYINYDSGIRLIIRPFKRKVKQRNLPEAIGV